MIIAPQQTNMLCGPHVNIHLSFDWISESPSKTATGTIAIQVKDYNDHCPELTTTTSTMCFEDNAVYVTATDKDEFPNSAPFEFSVIQTGSKQKWKVERLNGKTSNVCLS